MGKGVLGEREAGALASVGAEDSVLSLVRELVFKSAVLLNSRNAASNGPGVGGRLVLELVSGQQ